MAFKVKQALLPLKRIYNAVQSLSQRLRGILAYVIPGKYIPMTQLLICVNLFIFVLQQINRSVTELFVHRSNVWYSYLTACFLHGNVRHLAGNMLFFSFIVPQIEKKYGSYFLLIAYIITGIIGSMLMSFYLPHVRSLGASGSISGLMMIWIFHNIMEGRPFLVIAALFWFMREGVLSGIGLIKPDGIGHLAHFGSALGGFFFLPLVVYLRK